MNRFVKLTAISLLGLGLGLGGAGTASAGSLGIRITGGDHHGGISFGYRHGDRQNHRRYGLRHHRGHHGPSHLPRLRPRFRDRHYRHHGRLGHRYRRRGCHPVSKVVHDRFGRGKEIGGTMCYDRRGQPYIVPGSRHFLGYYR